jgi:hypothetical protein
VRVTAPRRRPPEHPAHSWASVVAFFRDCARVDPYFSPMHELAARLAESRYAAGGFPVQSMHTIRLYQQDRCSELDDAVHVSFEDGEFTVAYVPGASRPRRAGTPAVWSRRGGDGFGILEGCFRHLGWFVEYRDAGDASPRTGLSEPRR